MKPFGPSGRQKERTCVLASRSGTLAAVTTTALSLKYQRQCGVFGQQVHEAFVKPRPLMNLRCSRNTLDYRQWAVRDCDDSLCAVCLVLTAYTG